MERDIVTAGAEASTTARLLRAYHDQGDSQARQRLVELYLPLVDSLVRRHARTGDEYEDLFQVGCIGLINAIDRFDVERGPELAAFAVPTIAGEIRRYLRDRAGTVRLPRRVLDLRGPAVQAESELSAKLGRTPNTAEVAAELGAAEDDVALALDSARASSAVELAEDHAETAPDAADERLFLSEAIRELGERERRILYLRFMRDMGPAEAGRELGLSERQVSRDTQAALVKLRAALEGSTSASAPAERLPRGGSKPKMPPMGGTPAPTPAPRSEPGYHIALVKEDAPGSGWTAHVEELPGCEARGDTPDSAVAAVEVAMEHWIAEATAARREVPKPRSAASHSGRLMIRMPQSLHSELARAAQQEDVSLNQFITGALAAAVRWRAGAPRAEAEAEAPPPDLRRALLLNVVVLAIVAAVALILLVKALT